MKTNQPPRVANRRGMTLIELTVVILVLLSLISIMFIGARAWKRGSDRAGCIMSTRNMQLATRSYQNMYGYYFGDQPKAEYGTQDIASHLLAKDFISQNLFDQAEGNKPCNGGGSYSITAPSVFPMPGDLYMNCSLAGAEKHAPENTASW